MAHRKVKVIQLTGEVKTVNGVRQSDLAQRIEKELQAAYDNPGMDNIEVRPEVKWETAASGGNALLILTYDDTGKKQEEKKK